MASDHPSAEQESANHDDKLASQNQDNGKLSGQSPAVARDETAKVESSSQRDTSQSLHEPGAETKVMVDHKNQITNYWDSSKSDEGLYDDGPNPSTDGLKDSVEEVGIPKEVKSNVEYGDDEGDESVQADWKQDQEDQPERSDIPPRPSSSIGSISDDDASIQKMEDDEDEDERPIRPAPPIEYVTNDGSQAYETGYDDQNVYYTPGTGRSSRRSGDPPDEERPDETAPNLQTLQLAPLVGSPSPLKPRKNVLYLLRKREDDQRLLYERRPLRKQNDMLDRKIKPHRLQKSISADEIREDDREGTEEPYINRTSPQLTSPVSPPGFDEPMNQTSCDEELEEFLAHKFSIGEGPSSNEYPNDAIFVPWDKMGQGNSNRPRSAPPHERPVSAWSDSSSSDEDAGEDEEIEIEEQAQLQAKLKEERERRKQEELEIIKEHWRESLQSSSRKAEEMRPNFQPKFQGRSQSPQDYLLEQRTELHEKTMGLDDEIQFSFSAVIRRYRAEYHKVGFSPERREAMDWVQQFWAKDHYGMKQAWMRDRDQWKHQIKEWEKKRRVWASIRDGEREGREEEIAGFRKAHERQKQTSDVAREKGEFWRPELEQSIVTNEPSEPPVETRLSLVFSEPIENSRTSPPLPGSVTCSGDGGWQAPDAIEFVLPEGMALASPTSPERQSQLLENALRENEETSPEHAEPTTMLGSPSPERATSPSPDPASEVTQSCVGTCDGSRTAEFESTLTAAKEMEKVRGRSDELAELQERRISRRSSQSLHDSNKMIKTQQLISMAAATVEKVQVELLARQIEIVSIKRAVGMEVNDITISLSDISTRMIREPMYPTDEQEQKEKVREELLEKLYGLTGEGLDEAQEDAQVQLTRFFFEGGRLWAEAEDEQKAEKYSYKNESMTEG